MVLDVFLPEFKGRRLVGLDLNGVVLRLLLGLRWRLVLLRLGVHEGVFGERKPLTLSFGLLDSILRAQRTLTASRTSRCGRSAFVDGWGEHVRRSASRWLGA